MTSTTPSTRPADISAPAPAGPDGAKRVLLAAPRGYCAGVDRAVVPVEKALELYGPPVYVRKEIVHNKHVVRTLEKRGAIFVDQTQEVPEGARVIFSAHGVSPAVHEEARQLSLKTIDATCPLVTKVHREAVRFAAEDFTILLVGHEGHEEVEGTAGEAPDQTIVVESPEHAAEVEVPDPEKVIWLSQTTLSVDETMQTVRVLRERFPHLQDPPSDDICYATQNRQVAVKQMAGDCDLMIVVGSQNPPTPSGSSRSRWSTARRTATWSTMPTRSTRPGWTGCGPWVSPAGRACPSCWCATCWTGSPSAVTPMCPRSPRPRNRCSSRFRPRSGVT